MKEKSQYMYLEVNNLMVQVKFENEGVVVDVFDKDDDDELLATAYNYYSSLIIPRQNIE